MMNIIVASSEELKICIKEAMLEILESAKINTVVDKMELPENLTLNNAIKLLCDAGYPTSKAKIYKLTSSKDSNLPFKKYGNKLIFSKKELLQWTKEQTIVIKKGEYDKSMNILVKHAIKRTK